MLLLWVLFFNITDNSSVTVIGFQFELGRDSFQEPFFDKYDENEIE